MPRFSRIVASQAADEQADVKAEVKAEEKAREPEKAAAEVQEESTEDEEEVKAEAQKEEEKHTPDKAREVTYAVTVKRVALRRKPATDAQALLVLHKGERVCGVPIEVDNIAWLRISRESLKAHPLYKILDEEQDFGYVLIDATGTNLNLGVLLKRAPAELGWCAADEDEKETSEVWEVVKGSAVVSKGKDPNEPEADVLLEGCLVKAVEVDEAGGMMRFELVAGDGPESGWVATRRLKKVSLSLEERAAEAAPVERPKQDEQKAEEALKTWAENLWKKPQDGDGIFFQRESFDWRKGPRQEEPLPQLSEEELRRELSRALAAKERSAAAPAHTAKARPAGLGICGMCYLPLGETCYLHEKAKTVHAECLAQLLLQELKDEDVERDSKERAKKKLRREEYKIGWRPAEHIPLNFAPAAKLAEKTLPHGLMALSLAKDNAITLVPTTCPAAAVNLEYLSAALKVRLESASEPLFSLDPVDPDLKGSMQVKRFEPHWLKGTSVGDVLFESDYHLKELSFGEYDQPVVGMRSCFDFSDEEGFGKEWAAREWFVVRHAQVELSEDGVLIPVCKMGVEAREQILNKTNNLLEDVKVTRQNHPLVRYAEAFTHFFDLIAERKSVIYHLRELAKASILAKYLLESSIGLEQLWFELYEQKEGPCVLEVPQLWNERGSSQIQVQDGRIVNSSSLGDTLRAVYGGVQFGLDRARMAPAAGSLQARRGFVPSRVGLARHGFPHAMRGLRAPSSALSARRGFIPPSRGFVAPAAAISARPGFFAPSRMGVPSMAGRQAGPLRGVDLNLNKFSLTDTTPSSRKGAMAFSEDLEDAVTFGAGFWRHLDGGEASALSKEDMDVLRELFNPALSDRRSEGELFVPPDTNYAYGERLKKLMSEEREVHKKRKAHFFSTAFVMGNAGQIFPSSWTCDFEITRGGTAKKSLLPEAHLQPRPDFKEEASQLKQALEAAAPIFEQSTEDGLRWRIYRLGSLEVRTTREPGGEEEVGAVFTVSESGKKVEPEVGQRAKIDETERVERMTLYVEIDPEDSDKHAARFYVVAETEKGNVVVTEKLRDGTATWQENPRNVADRNSLAKVVKSADKITRDKDPPSLSRLRSYQSSRDTGDASSSDRHGYAEGAFGRVTQSRLQCKLPEPFDLFVARHYPRIHALLGQDGRLVKVA